MNYRARAKRLLLHYFKLAFSFPTDGDVEAEIEGIVDDIIDAVKQELQNERRAAIADVLAEIERD